MHLNVNLIFGNDKDSSFGRKHGVKDALQDAAAVPHEFKLREHHQKEAADAETANTGTPPPLSTAADSKPPADEANARADALLANQPALSSSSQEVGGLLPNTLGPVEYKIHGFINYTMAWDFCAKREGRLCMQSELCPDGPFKEPAVPMPDGDLFVATQREPGSKQMDCASKAPNAGGENAKSPNSW